MREEEKLTFDEEKHQYRYCGKSVPSVTELCSLLTSQKYGDINPSVILKAQMRGTAVHELTEAIDYGAEPEEIDPELFGYIVAYKKFLKDYQPNWIAIEKMVGFEKFAGTIDRVGIIDDVPVIVDLKTTSNMDRISKIALCCQLLGYCLLWTNNTGQIVDYSKCFGIQLKDDGTYTRIDLSECEEKYKFDTKETFEKLLFVNAIMRGNKK